MNLIPYGMLFVIKYSDGVFGWWRPLSENIDSAEEQGVFLVKFYLENPYSSDYWAQKSAWSEHFAQRSQGKFILIQSANVFLSKQ